MSTSSRLSETNNGTADGTFSQNVRTESTSAKKFKVAEVIEATFAGVGRHVLDLVDGLLSENVDVHLIYSPIRMSDEFRESIQNFAERGATLFECPISSQVQLSDYAATRQLRRYLLENGPFDLIHGHSSKGGAIARLAARGMKTPVLYTPHAISTWNPRISRKGYLVYGTFERILAKWTNCIVAVSEEESDHCIKLGLPASKIKVVPNCINKLDLPTREEVREKYQLPLDKRVLGFVGRLEPQKGPEVMIEAFKRIASQFPDVVLAMIGGGELETSLRQQVREADLTDRVYFLGPQPGNWSMPGFDIFCMTSRYEAGGYPYVAQEAAYAGLPIVTTRFQCRELIVDEGENGFIVENDDDVSLAKGLETLLASPEKLAEFGRNSAAKFNEFSAETMVSRYMNLYQSLLKQN
ncbi:MAG: glycosyltransferase [Planctomycetaceae bacterium]|nr:glycosyltransferase [Planctomycetaceae bacterium]